MSDLYSRGRVKITDKNPAGKYAEWLKKIKVDERQPHRRLVGEAASA
jgi:hypothetical protein